MRRSNARAVPLRSAQHAVRVLLLVGLAAGLYGTLAARAEVTSTAALAAVRAAEHAGAAPSAPGLHVLAIRSVHAVLPGQGPERWEHAAQGVAVLSAALAVIPVYLLALELYEASTAWVGTLLFLSSSLVGYLVANAQGECLFLLCWAWGIWAAIRFLRDGRWFWLPLFVGSATCAGSLRLDGTLLALCFWGVVGVMPWNWAAPARRAAVWPVFLALNVALVAACAVKPGTPQPSIETPSRAGLNVRAASAGDTIAHARPAESGWQFCGRTLARMWKVTRDAVSLRLVPLALLGLLLAWSGPAQARVWLFLALLLVGSLGLLIERRATAGDCALGDALVPGLLLILPAGHGLGRLVRRAVVQGVDWRGRTVTYRPGPLVWLGLLLVLVVLPNLRPLAPADSRGAFAPYRAASAWLAERGAAHARILDFTGWTTFELSRLPASLVRGADRAPSRDRVLLVARQGQVLDHSRTRGTVALLVGENAPVACFPRERRSPGLAVWIYELDPERLERAEASREKDREFAELRLISDEKQSIVKH